MVYEVGDGYTFSSDIVIPIEYESVEKAEYDFLAVWEDMHKAQEKSRTFSKMWIDPMIKIFNQGFDYYDFIKSREDHEDKIEFEEPKFYTLEDWWERNLRKDI